MAIDGVPKNLEPQSPRPAPASVSAWADGEWDATIGRPTRVTVERRGPTLRRMKAGRGSRRDRRGCSPWRDARQPVVIVGCCWRPARPDGIRLGRAGGSDHRIVVHTDEVVGPFDRRLLGTNVPAWLLPRARRRRRSSALSRWRRAPRCCACPAAAGATTTTGWAASSVIRNAASGPGRCGRRTSSGCSRPPVCPRCGRSRSTARPRKPPRRWRSSTAASTTIARSARTATAATGRRSGTGRSSGPSTDIPSPSPIRYWEVGNEVYGAVKAAGPDCASWGWEDVWTCDGTEYVKGTADHDGFLAVPRGDAGGRRRHRGRRGRRRRPGRVERLGRQGDEGRRRRHRLLRRAPLRLERRRCRPRTCSASLAAQWPRITNDIRDGYADHGIGRRADRGHRAQPRRVHRRRRRTADDDGGQRVLPRRDDRADGDERRHDRQPVEPGQRACRERHRLRPHRRADAPTQPRVLRDGPVVALRRRARAGGGGRRPRRARCSTAGAAPTDRPSCS